MKKTLLCLLAFAAMSVKAQVNIKVDVAQRGIEISPTLYGIFYEDINYASDGGLYAELIRNRSFEYDAIARNSRNRPSDATSKLDGDHVRRRQPQPCPRWLAQREARSRPEGRDDKTRRRYQQRRLLGH